MPSISVLYPPSLFLTFQFQLGDWDTRFKWEPHLSNPTGIGHSYFAAVLPLSSKPFQLFFPLTYWLPSPQNPWLVLSGISSQRSSPPVTESLTKATTQLCLADTRISTMAQPAFSQFTTEAMRSRNII